MDIARGEQVETELDRLIERRDTERRRTEAERRMEELWAESVRRYNARQREQNRWEWVRYFDRIAASLRTRAQEYDRRAEELLEGQGEGDR